MKILLCSVEGDLINLLNKWGIDVTETTEREKTQYNGRTVEIDIVARNGKEIVIVEVKTTLHPQDVEDFLETLTIFKKAFPRYKENKIFGAVAYLKTESKANVRAERMGLFVIRATGNSASIVNSKKFKPKEF